MFSQAGTHQSFKTFNNKAIQEYNDLMIQIRTGDLTGDYSWEVYELYLHADLVITD